MSEELFKNYICPDVPDEGYIEAKNINEAKNILGCSQCINDEETSNKKCKPKRINTSYYILANENACMRREIIKLRNEIYELKYELKNGSNKIE